MHRVAGQLANHRSKLFGNEIEEVEQEIVHPDYLDVERCQSLSGEVSNVVRDDRVRTGDERTCYDVSVFLIGQNDRALEALPSRD